MAQEALSAEASSDVGGEVLGGGEDLALELGLDGDEHFVGAAGVEAGIAPDRDLGVAFAELFEERRELSLVEVERVALSS